MDFSYENQGANTYLVYEIKEGDSIDTLSLGMLTNNSIPGLTRALFTQMDEKRYIKYNVSSKVSMQQFFGGVVNRKRLLGVFSGITEGFLSAEDYMIDTSSIVLDPEYIFADVTTCAAALICLPIANAEGTEPDLGAFFKSVVVNAQTDPTEDSDHVAKILNFLNSSSVFSLPGFKKLLDDLRNEPSAPTVTVEVKKIPNGQPSVGAPAVPPVQKTAPVHVPPAQPIITPAVPPAVSPPISPRPAIRGSISPSLTTFVSCWIRWPPMKMRARSCGWSCWSSPAVRSSSMPPSLRATASARRI